MDDLPKENDASLMELDSEMDLDSQKCLGVGSPLKIKPQKEVRIVLEKCNVGGEFKGNFDQETRKEVEKVLERKVEVKCRSQQLKLLGAAIGGGKETKHKLPGTLFLWGAPSTGKSSTLDYVLEQKDVHAIRIHALEILCGRRAFFETFVKQLVSKDCHLGPNFKCDTLRSLYSNVYEYFCQESTPRSLRVVVVIEAAEKLRGEHDDILRFFVALQDITQCPISTVLISTLPVGQFMPNVLDHSVIPIYFPQYTMDELTTILVELNSDNCKASKGDSFEFYVKMIVSMFYYICRDLRKLLRLTISHWESFQGMVDSSDEVNFSKLWKKLEPRLKDQFFELNSAVTTVGTTGNPNFMEPGTTLNIPLNAKYLLIASYLATYNPPASDKRFFVKSKAGKVKRSRKTLKTETATKTTSARSFELNRLNAIFSSIQMYCDDRTVNKNRNISVMCLLTTLCQNKLIQHIGEDSIGNQKYKCLLDYDSILEISRSVNFELNNYLYRLI